MVDWQLTATTIYCDTVQDEVTIFVYRDGSLGCTGFGHNGEKGNQNARKPDAACPESTIKPGCVGLPCKHTTEYRNILLAEENNQDG